jgi:cell division protein FtsB
MKPLLFVLAMMLVCFASSAFSNDAPAPQKAADLEEQVKSLSAKLEALEKRLATLEAENEKLREAIANPRVHVIQAPQRQKQERPKFHLLNHTELGIPWDVERAMIGGAREQNLLQQDFGAPQKFEFKFETPIVPLPEPQLNMQP